MKIKFCKFLDFFNMQIDKMHRFCETPEIISLGGGEQLQSLFVNGDLTRKF